SALRLGRRAEQYATQLGLLTSLDAFVSASQIAFKGQVLTSDDGLCRRPRLPKRDHRWAARGRRPRQRQQHSTDKGTAMADRIRMDLYRAVVNQLLESFVHPRDRHRLTLG